MSFVIRQLVSSSITFLSEANYKVGILFIVGLFALLFYFVVISSRPQMLYKLVPPLGWGGGGTEPFCPFTAIGFKLDDYMAVPTSDDHKTATILHGRI